MKRVHPMSSSSSAPARVTVVIPCYNYARYLASSVRSALTQEEVDVDVVVVDDASTDNSVEIAERLVENDARVRLVRHHKNEGHVETSNEALSHASGTFVVKLDADDMLTKGSLARSAALMHNYPDVVFCYGYAQNFRGEPPNGYTTRVRNWSIWPGEEWISRVLRRAHNVITQPEVMLRRDAIVSTGGYRSQLRWAEDFNWWLRLACEGSVGRVNGATQGLYRIHDASFQRSVDDIEVTDLRARIAAVEMFFEECGPNLHDAAKMRRTAFSALAREARRQAARRTVTPVYDDIARDLESRYGIAPRRTLSTSRTVLGTASRDLEDRLRWRRWRRYGT